MSTVDIIKTKIGFFKVKSVNGKITSSKFVDANNEEINNQQIATDVKNYFKGKSVDLQSKLKVCGTPFQIKVWAAIKKIPCGETKTYKEIAQSIGQPKSYRAVANACGQNKLALFIPCHRVVGKNNLGGYKWGVETKEWLINHESNWSNS